MSAPFKPFQDEVLDLVAGLTGTRKARTIDPAGSGHYLPQTLFTSVEAATLSIVEYMAAGLAGKGPPPPPYVAVQIGSLVHDPQWGVRGMTYRAAVSIAILDAASQSTQDDVHDLAQGVADAIDDGDLAPPFFRAFQSPPERATVDSSDANTVFAYLGDQSKAKVVAATVVWSPGLLVSL